MDYTAPYGDLTALNTCRDLMDAVGREILLKIVQGHLNLLGTSAAVYEVNGDYATALFTSDYCRFLDCASRRLCGTEDNAAALASGKWHCHESCWTQASKVSVETGRPFDLRPCLGGINIYAVPIISKGRVIGALSFGYGAPPRDEKTLREIAQRYQVDVEELRRVAEHYEPRPDFITEVAKQQTETAAELVAGIYERRQAEETMKRLSHQHQLILDSVAEGIYGVDLQGNTTFVNPAAVSMTGYAAGELIGRHQHDILHHSKPDGTPYPREECKIYAAFKDGAVHHVADEVFWRKDGTSFPVEYLSAPIRERGELAGAVVVFKDITERKRAEDRIRREAARAKALAEVSQTLTGAGLEYQAVLDTVTRHIAELVGDACVIRLQSDDGQWLSPVAFHHPNPEALTFMRDLPAAVPVGVDEGLFGRVVQTGQPLLIPVVSPEQARALTKPEYWPYLERFGIHSFLIVPLRAQDRVIGTLSLMRINPGRPHTADDQAFLQDLADRVALAIANSRLYSENQRQLESLGTLYTSAQKLVQSLDLREQAGDVARTCVEVFGARLAWLGRAEADGRVRLLTHFPTGAEYPRQITVRWDGSPFGQGPTGYAIRTGSPVIITDIAGDANFIPWREAALNEGFCCAAAFPLISRDKSFGGMMLYSDQSGFFTQERVEFFQTYAYQAAAALENARLFEEAQRRLEHLQALRDIDMAITASLDLRVTFNVVLDQVINQLGIHAADILLLNQQQTLEYAAGRGFRFKDIERSSLRLGEGYAGRAALESRIVYITNLHENGDDFTRAPLLAGEDFIAYYGVPLIAKGQVKGVLEILHRAPLNPDPEWLDFLETLAGQVAIAIDNAALFEGMQRSNIELTLAYDATIEGWSYALDLRDKETEGHSQRVTEMTLRLVRAMGMSEAELVHVRRGALLHDIGKLGIQDDILLKPGPLTDEEWEIMRLHPVYAFEMLSPIAYLRPALDIPYCHHEKWDGTGYPRGLQREQIPLAARIFALVDVWDALRSERPYRPAWPEDKAREYIREQAGKHFDPKVVKVFLEMEW